MNSQEMIIALGHITTRDESGRHFTEVFPGWEALEESGLIDVYRPIHIRTGMAYSQEYWYVNITDEGQALVDANEDLFRED